MTEVRGPKAEAAAKLERLLELNLRLVEKTKQLESALESRIVIEQAKGMLAGRYGIDVTAAFEAMRRGARSHQLHLHDLAQRVVDEADTPLEIARFL